MARSSQMWAVPDGLLGPGIPFFRDLRQGDVTAGTVMHRSPLPRCRADRSAGAADTGLVSADIHWYELPVVSKLGNHPDTAVGGRLSQCPRDLGQRADVP